MTATKYTTQMPRPCTLKIATCTLLSLLLMLSGCKAQLGSTLNSFYASGQPNLTVTVNPPLEFASSAVLGAPVPSDVNISPRGTFRYSLFTEKGDNPLMPQVHTILSELPRFSWRWEMETWEKPESLAYSKLETPGKYWTVQTFPVAAQGDWFSTLRQENGENTPAFWLAKRWSATKYDTLRIVVEYREAAPACMQEKLQAVLDSGYSLSALNGKDLWRSCSREVDEFSKRANASISLENFMEPAASIGTPALKLPGIRPDMARLVGRAERVENNTDRYKD